MKKRPHVPCSYVVLKGSWPEPERFTRHFCRAARLTWDVKLHSLAGKAGVSADTLIRWERGEWASVLPSWRVSVCAALRLLAIDAARAWLAAVTSGSRTPVAE